MCSRPCTISPATSASTIAARYVVDCSGGHSPIRRALDIGMSGSDYLGYFLSIFVRAPELWTHHKMGKAALINFVEPNGLWRNLISLDGRDLYRFGVRGKAYLRRARARSTPSGCSTRWSASRCRTRSSRSGAGPRAMWWPTATAPGAFSSPATPRISTIRRPGSASTPASATRSISAGSSPPCITGWAPATLLDSYEIERRPVGRRNVGHADDKPRQRPRAEARARRRRRHAGRRARPPAAHRRHPAVADPQGDHRRARARLSLRPLADRLGRRHAAAGGHRQRVSPECAARQPRAACLHRAGTLDHRPVRQRLRADAARRGAARRVSRSSARSRSAACRSAWRRSTIRTSPRSTSASSCWCGPTAMSPGAPMRRRPIRWRLRRLRCRAAALRCNPPPRRSACRRDRRGGSCRAGTWRSSFSRATPSESNSIGFGRSCRFCFSTSARFFLNASMLGTRKPM